MKKILALILTGVIAVSVLVGCSTSNSSSTQPSLTPSSQPEVSSTPVELTPMTIAALKGPTAMGLVKLMDEQEQMVEKANYTFQIEGAADKVTGLLVSGELSAAAIPANLASVLYNKTNGGIKVIGINTLGVLYVVENGNTIQSVADLKGKTIYSTGKGTTPEFALNYILSANDIDPTKDVTIEFKSEATEIAAIMAEDKNAIAVLPQPYVTIAQTKNPNIRIALDLTNEWDNTLNGASDSGMVTGVIVVNTKFLEENKDSVNAFMDSYKASTEFINTNIDDGAKLVAKYDIAPEPVAKKAIPYCNITFIEGDDMKAKLSGYLEVLFNQNPQAVGGKLPDENFYYQR